MSRKFKLELDFDISKQSQSELATLLHTIARSFDIGLDSYNVKETPNPIEIIDNKYKVVGSWTYE